MVEGDAGKGDEGGGVALVLADQVEEATGDGDGFGPEVGVQMEGEGGNLKEDPKEVGVAFDTAAVAPEEEAVFVKISGVGEGDKLVVNLGIPEGRAREAEEGGGEEAAPSAVHDVLGSHVRGRFASDGG